MAYAIPKRDWLSIISLSNHIDLPFSDVTVKPLTSLVIDKVHDTSFELTHAKFPKWPYRLNKRADKFFIKTFNSLVSKQQFDVHEQIEKIGNNYCVFLADDKLVDESTINDKLLSMFEQYQGLDTQQFDLIKQITIPCIDTTEDDE